jgi:antitoxin ParD1/3/4
MKVRGIKRGQSIEILEQLNNIPDGTEIIVDLELIESQITESQQIPTEAERLAKLNQLFGAWKNQPELTEIFTEIDQQRHAYQGRNINSINNPDNE